MLNDKKRKEALAPERLINRIVEGTVIEGEIRCESNLRIDGKVLGATTTKGRLVVGASGLIDGEVNCQYADIEGTVVGKITVEEMLTLKASARITGDIVAKKLAVEPGASFNGNCTMGAVIKDINQSLNNNLAKAK